MILTNLGVYILNDFEQSSKQDPSEHQALKVPKEIERFPYTSVKKVSVAYHLSQRIVIEVVKPREHMEKQLLKREPEQVAAAESLHATTRAGNTTMINTTAGADNQKRLRVKNEQSYVTLIVPNLVDSVQIRAIFDEAVTFDSEDDDEEVEKKTEEDLLVNHILLETINSSVKSKTGKDKVNLRGKCPFCRNSRIKDKTEALAKRCMCSYHLVYAFKMKSERPLKVVSKSKQRGGSARLLSTPQTWHV